MQVITAHFLSEISLTFPPSFLGSKFLTWLVRLAGNLEYAIIDTVKQKLPVVLKSCGTRNKVLMLPVHNMQISLTATMPVSQCGQGKRHAAITVHSHTSQYTLKAFVHRHGVEEAEFQEIVQFSSGLMGNWLTPASCWGNSSRMQIK